MEKQGKDFFKQRSQKYNYQSGWGNEFVSEARANIVPDQNSPQKCLFICFIDFFESQGNEGLYAEQISGTAFTVCRSSNRRTWLYRYHESHFSDIFSHSALFLVRATLHFRRLKMECCTKARSMRWNLIRIKCDGTQTAWKAWKARKSISRKVGRLLTRLIDRPHYDVWRRLASNEDWSGHPSLRLQCQHEEQGNV